MYAQQMQQSMGKFRVLLAVVVSLVVGMMMFCVPNQAQAQGLNVVTCAGAGSVFWSPGLTNQTQTVTASYQMDAPTCLNLSGLSLIYAQGSSTNTSQLSCTELFPGEVGQTWNLTWSDSSTSTLTFIPEEVGVDGIVGYEALGNITSGRFAGSTAYIVFTAIDVNGLLQNQCASSGLTSANAQVVVQIF
jgi:hypothetical protein